MPLVIAGPDREPRLRLVQGASVWKASLDTIPEHPRFRYRQVVPAIFIGFLLNTALIARIGEVGRMFVLRRRRAEGLGVTLPMPTIAGTLVMEQLVLGITLVAVRDPDGRAAPERARQIIDGVIVLTGAVVALRGRRDRLELLARWRSRRNPDARPPAQQPRATWRSFLRSRLEAVLAGMASGLALLARRAAAP